MNFTRLIVSKHSREAYGLILSTVDADKSPTIMEHELQGWPVAQPHILVSTPAALLNCMYAFDPEKKRRSEFLRDVTCVVTRSFLNSCDNNISFDSSVLFW